MESTLTAPNKSLLFMPSLYVNRRMAHLNIFFNIAEELNVSLRRVQAVCERSHDLNLLPVHHQNSKVVSSQ